MMGIRYYLYLTLVAILYDRIDYNGGMKIGYIKRNSIKVYR